MSGDSQDLKGAPLEQAVREVISEVLVVPLDEVRPTSSLLDDLEAESIDFLDLVFRLEHRLGKGVNLKRWEAYVARNLQGGDAGSAIDTDFIVAFATWCLSGNGKEGGT